MTAPLASIEGVEHFAENVVFVIAQGKQGHARLQFQVVGGAEDLRCRPVGVSQHQSRAFDESGAEYRVLQIVIGLLNRCECESLRHGASAESRDLGKDEPHPMRCLPARLQLGADTVIDGLLSENEVVEHVFHAEWNAAESISACPA